MKVLKALKQCQKHSPARYRKLVAEFEETKDFSGFNILVHRVARGVRKSSSTGVLKLNQATFFRFMRRIGEIRKDIRKYWARGTDENGVKLKTFKRRGQKYVVIEDEERDTRSSYLDRGIEAKKERKKSKAVTAITDELEDSEADNNESEESEEEEGSGSRSDGDDDEEEEEEAEQDNQESEEEESESSDAKNADGDDADEGGEEEEECDSDETEEEESEEPKVTERPLKKAKASPSKGKSITPIKANPGVVDKKVRKLEESIQNADGQFEDASAMWLMQENIEALTAVRLSEAEVSGTT